MRVLLPLLGLVGCDGGQSGENLHAKADPCEWEVVDPSDASLGFSALEVAEALESPVGVSWEISEDGATADTVSFTGFEVAGPVRIATLQIGTDCSAETEWQLVVPVEFDAEIGDGGVVGHGMVELWAADLALDRIRPVAGWTFPVTLSGSYAEALGDWLDDESATPDADPTELNVFLGLLDTWAQLQLDVGVYPPGSDTDSRTSLWRGPADFGTDAP